MRLIPSFHSSFPDARAVRTALAAGAVAGLVVIAACTDAGTSSKALTAPAGPRTATTSSGTEGHGNGFAGHVIVCVDASSPSGTYKFRNSGWNNHTALVNGVWNGVPFSAGGDDPGDGGDALAPNNGTTVWTPARNDNSEYIVTPGDLGCITVLDRTAPAAHYSGQDPVYLFGPDHQDDWQAINVTASTYPSTAQYDHTDCVMDNGVVDPQPTPCGNTNNPTRAFANYDHGTKVTFVFTASATSTGQITPTATTCEDYAQGTSATLSELDAGFKNTKVNNVAPGVFFYYAQVTKGAGQTVGFTQTVNPNAAGLPKYDVQQTQAYLYTYNSTTKRCTNVITLPLSVDGTVSPGGGAGLPAGNYILGVKFATDAPRGTTVASAALRTSGALLATHNYAATVNGSSDPTTAGSVNTITK